MLLIPACTDAEAPTPDSAAGGTGGGTTTTQDPGSETDAPDPGDDTDGDDDPDGSESSSSGGDADVCVFPQGDELDGSMTIITIRNDAAEPRYMLPSSNFFCSAPQFELILDGESVLADGPGAAPFRCETCDGTCNPGSGTGLVINPGATAEIAWNGGYWSAVERSEACGQEACEDIPGFEDDSPATACEVLRAMGTQDYTVRVAVSQTCPSDEESCMCEDDVCPFPTKARSAEFTVEASATFPEAASLVLE
ncbi:MAG: hypothetical protein AAGA54_27850 [Myxococcota bacterium]